MRVKLVGTEHLHTPGFSHVTGRSPFHLMVLVSGAGNSVEAPDMWVTIFTPTQGKLAWPFENNAGS